MEAPRNTGGYAYAYNDTCVFAPILVVTALNDRLQTHAMELVDKRDWI